MTKRDFRLGFAVAGAFMSLVALGCVQSEYAGGEEIKPEPSTGDQTGSSGDTDGETGSTGTSGTTGTTGSPTGSTGSDTDDDSETETVTDTGTDTGPDTGPTQGCTDDGDCAPNIQATFCGPNGFCKGCNVKDHCGPGCPACGGKRPVCGGGLLSPLLASCQCNATSCSDQEFCNPSGNCAACVQNLGCGPDCDKCSGNTPSCVGASVAGAACGCNTTDYCPAGTYCDPASGDAGACVDCGTGESNQQHCGDMCLNCDEVGGHCNDEGNCPCADISECAAGANCVNESCVPCNQNGYCGASCADCTLNADAPVCSETLTCVECVQETDCSGDTPMCVENNTCGCLVDGDCGAGRWCNSATVATGECEACSAELQEHCGPSCLDCSADPGHKCIAVEVDTDGDTETQGDCASCDQDEYCGAGCADCTGDTDAPHCGADADGCVECRGDEHCTANPDKSHCNSEVCAECSAHDHCTEIGKPFCDTSNGTCTSCFIGELYAWDFEGDNGGFTEYPEDSLWEHGDIVSGPPVDGHGKVWATGLSGDYPTCDVGAYLNSPVIDLSQCSVDMTIVVSVDVWYRYDYNPGVFGIGKSFYEGFALEIYDGTAWIQITPSGLWDASSYTMSSNSTCGDPWASAIELLSGFGGESSGWETKTFQFSAATYPADFQVRFVHGSDGSSIADSGAFVDNVRISAQ